MILPFQLSAFEQDALNHYPGKPSRDLVQSLSGAVLAFYNILPQLHQAGVRMRIVPEGTKVTDLPECIAKHKDVLFLAAKIW